MSVTCASYRGLPVTRGFDALVRQIPALAPVVLVLAACSAVPGPSPSASSITPAPIDSPLPSPSLEPSPSEVATPTKSVVDAVPFPPDTYARVATNDLRLRSKPGVSDDSKKLKPLLQDGQTLVVLDGPVQASGYDWYQVQPIDPSDDGTEPFPFGWVAAAAKDGEAWIETEAVNCPALPTDPRQISSLDDAKPMYYQITCFSGQEITFPARLVTPSEWCGLGEWAAIDPVWMGTCTTAPNYLVALDDDDGNSTLHPLWSPDVDLSFAPEVEAPREAWPTVEVTGLFDHPEARTCGLADGSTYSPTPDPALLSLDCRVQFVVTSMREIDG